MSTVYENWLSLEYSGMLSGVPLARVVVSSRRRHTRLQGDWSPDVCSSDLPTSVVGCTFFQAEDGIRNLTVTGVQTCALPISASSPVASPACASCSLGGRCTGTAVSD